MCGIAYSSQASGDCDDSFVKANAIFIHATVECEKNYMDSPAGYYALAMARKCIGLGETKMKEITKNAMLEFDHVKKVKGKKDACRWADSVEKAVNDDKPN